MSLSSTRWPTFLGIGVPKAGSTWLYEILKCHPDIWVPKHEREVKFFNRYREDRGLSWYSQFFPECESASYRAVGEVSPSYIYCEAQQIEAIESTVPTVNRFILILRNPVDRLYSAYWNRRRLYRLDVSFRTFIEESVEGAEKNIRRGRYAKYVKRWFRYFDRTQFLILTVESDLTDPELAREKIADFLHVDPDAFPDEAGKSKENVSHLPKFRSAYSWAASLNKKLKRMGLYSPSVIARKLGVKHWFGKRKVGQEMDQKLREKLKALYKEDVERLRKILGMELSKWDV